MRFGFGRTAQEARRASPTPSGESSGNATFIANYQPLQYPYGGPNYFFMDPQALYEVHVTAKRCCTTINAFIS